MRSYEMKLTMSNCLCAFSGLQPLFFARKQEMQLQIIATAYYLTYLNNVPSITWAATSQPLHSYQIHGSIFPLIVLFSIHFLSFGSAAFASYFLFLSFHSFTYIILLMDKAKCYRFSLVNEQIMNVRLKRQSHCVDGSISERSSSQDFPFLAEKIHSAFDLDVFFFHKNNAKTFNYVMYL